MKYLQENGVGGLAESQRLSKKVGLTGAPGGNRIVVSQDDFLFGAQSAQEYEEYNVLKTNRHSIRQRRVLVLDGSEIYHRKPLIDTKSGVVMRAKNNVPTAPSEAEELNNSCSQGTPPSKRKVGVLKARVNNFMSSGIFQGSKKSRYV